MLFRFSRFKPVSVSTGLSPRRAAVLLTAALLSLAPATSGAGQFPRPGRTPIPGPNQEAAVLVEAIAHARESYEFEVFTLSVYEAALKTTQLEGEARIRAEQFYEEHKKHHRQLLDLLDRLGAKYEETRPIKKNYNWMESEAAVLERLIKQEKDGEKQFGRAAKKTRNQTARAVFTQLRDQERGHLKAYEPLKRSAGK